MDPRLSAQDVLRCDLCENPVPPMYCDFCHVKLCKACVGEHLSDLSKEHKVVPYKQKGTSHKYPKCPTHIENRCELHCEECDLPVCSVCLTSNFHKGHTLLNLLEIIKIKQKTMQKDVDELTNSVCLKHKEFFREIEREKITLEKQYKKLTTDVTKQGEDWHREINIVVDKNKSEIDEMKTKHLAILEKQGKEIKHIYSEVKQCILDLKKILDSSDISLISAYKSRNAEFKRLPPKINISVPSFSPHQINTKQLHQMFGSLSVLSITKEEYGYPMETPEAAYCPPVKPLLEEPELITTINTSNYRYPPVDSVACLSDEEIWTCGFNRIIELFNLQGKLLKSIQTKPDSRPHDITVTRGGDLVYTDRGTGTVNIVKNDQIQEVIRLQGWIPENICSTFSGDLLVTMISDDYKRTRVVRYSGSTEKQIIQFDSKGKPMYSSGDGKYISENRNLDICVADYRACEVVVTNQAGKLRFRYTGPPNSLQGLFNPNGITTDSQSQILTSDSFLNYIHIVDQAGQFLRYIDNCDLQNPKGLCVDTKDNLIVANSGSCNMKKIKYM